MRPTMMYGANVGRLRENIMLTGKCIVAVKMLDWTSFFKKG